MHGMNLTRRCLMAVLMLLLANTVPMWLPLAEARSDRPNMEAALDKLHDARAMMRDLKHRRTPLELLSEARGYLTDASNDYGGHKRNALRLIDRAASALEARQPERALDYVGGAIDEVRSALRYSDRRD